MCATMATMHTDTELAVSAAQEAGEALLRIRAAGAASHDALGRAGDLGANALILDRLHAARPGDAILSEESIDDPVRLTSDRVWIVDPLDGTREFVVAGRTDWAVHVALWTREGGLTAAAVTLPALDTTLSTDDVSNQLAKLDSVPLIVVSASRAPAFAAKLGAALGGRIITMGSAGAKAMAVVRGEADAYVHGGGQWEWDSAAPVAFAAESSRSALTMSRAS